jgi:predicted NUDIX family NTP pyrophosphohydrolase
MYHSRYDRWVGRRSAGILLYRFEAGRLEVLLVHPGGPFWARKEERAWSIPKGEIDEGEDPLTAARREFQEETGTRPEGDATPLKPCRQAGGKTVLAFALHGEFNPATLRSNTFKLEWPPRSGRFTEAPEVDRAAWFTLPEARAKIVGGQEPLLVELEELVGRAGRPA